MTWISSAAIAFDGLTRGSALDGWDFWPATGSLGSSVAGKWSWNDDEPSRPHDGATARYASQEPQEYVRMSAPADLRRQMAAAARARGRSESDIWVEAAREWLGAHNLNASPDYPVAGNDRDGASHTSRARRDRVWRDIDYLLNTLREEERPAAEDRIPA